jgi:hypothetical protein
MTCFLAAWITAIWPANSTHKKQKLSYLVALSPFGRKKSGDSAGIRTQDPYIKSVLLYLLSYGIIEPILPRTDFFIRGCKDTDFWDI